MYSSTPLVLDYRRDSENEIDTYSIRDPYSIYKYTKVIRISRGDESTSREKNASFPPPSPPTSKCSPVKSSHVQDLSCNTGKYMHMYIWTVI